MESSSENKKKKNTPRKTITVSKDLVDSMDLSKYKGYNLDIGNKYMYLGAGEEHFKLLAFISNAFSSKRFLALTTDHGCAGLALGFNKKNKVVAVSSLNDRRECFSKESNIKFKDGAPYSEIKGGKFDVVLLNSSDPYFFETVSESYLQDFVSAGSILIVDNCLEYDCAKAFVDKLSDSFPVYDLTKYGHSFGTHLIDFSGGLTLKLK